MNDARKRLKKHEYTSVVYETNTVYQDTYETRRSWQKTVTSTYLDLGTMLVCDAPRLEGNHHGDL